MDNFQYSIQLSDQDWAEFSATADECGRLQAALASGDELLSSDIDQGDSSGSSPPGPPPFITGQLASGGRGWRGYKVEDVVTQQLVSRSQCEPVLDLETSQQSAGTSAQSEVLSLSLESTCPDQCLLPPGSGASRDKMQRLLQGPAPSPSGEPPLSPDSPGHSAAPQRPPDSPVAPLRSPGRKKRRAVGSKGGKCFGSPGPAAVQMGSPLLMEARPEEGLVAGAAKLMEKSPQDSAGAPEHSSSAPEQVARPGHGWDLSTPVPISEQGTDQIRMNPRAELHTVPKFVQKVHPDISLAKPDVALSIPTSKPQTDMALSTSASNSQADITLSTHASKPEVTSSALAFKPQPDMSLSVPASEPGRALSTPDSTPQLDKAGSLSASTPRLHADLPSAGPGVDPESGSSMPMSGAVPVPALPAPVSKAEREVGISLPAMPSLPTVSQPEAAMVDTEVVIPPGDHQEKPGGELSAGAFGSHLGGPLSGTAQIPKRKKVRFSMAVPGCEEPGSGRPACLPSLAPAGPPTPRTAIGSRGASAAWDAVAVGPRPPQPRILKHLPPPAPSASAGPEPGNNFAVTLPEAYEFFFCDTIKEEDESVEDEAAASQDPEKVQWPDSCEFFFQDCGAQRSRRQGRRSPVLSPGAEATAAAPPGDLVPISIPEAYEHFFGEEGSDGLLPGTLLQLQTSEPSREVAPEAPSEPAPATAELLGLTAREAGELRGPLTSFTFSQNDMCLVFVAFATWAVRTSDLHAPDAWKTVLLANIGTISAIRYFRRQARRERSPTRSPSSSSSPSC